MNKMNQTQTRSPRKRLLSLILAVILMIGLLPISAFATSASAQASEDKAATQDSEFLRIFHLDCGRKYFTVSEIEGIIDQLAENHYTHIQLAFGNDGLRFLLDDMSVTVNGTEYDSKKVTTAIKNGNSSLTSGSSGELSEKDMNDIIAYANGKGIQVIPLFNAPGHMYTVVKAMDSLKMGGRHIEISNLNNDYDKRTSNWAVDSRDAVAVAFAEALLQKYAVYFAAQGSTMFNIGADESGINSDNYTTLYPAYAKMVNAMSKIVKSAGMKTLAYNDGIYNPSFSSALEGKDENGANLKFDTDIIICYWTADNASVQTLLSEGFQILNNNGDWYYVLGDYLKVAWQSDQWSYDRALENIKKTPVTKMMKYDGTEKPLGSILCVWCDAPNQTYDSAKVYNLIKTMAEQNPDYFKDTTPVLAPVDGGTVSPVKQADGSYNVAVAANDTVQLKLSNASDVSWSSSNEAVAKVDVSGLVTFTGKTGTVKITAQLQPVTRADEGASYTVTFNVTEKGAPIPVTVAVGRTSKAYDLTGDNLPGDDTYKTDDGIASYTIATSTGKMTATKATSIDSKTEYIIGNGSQYLKLSGSSITSTTKLADATKWTISSSGTGYTIKSAGYYLGYSGSNWQYSPTVSSTRTIWNWSTSDGFSVSTYNYDCYLTYSNGWALSYYPTAANNGQPYTTTAEKAGTTVTFKGLKVGTTSVTIGGTTYSVTVVEKQNVEIPISIIDYRADGLLFDWTYNPGSTYSDSYRYGLVHTKAVDWGVGDGNGVNAYTNADGNLEVNGTADGVEKIEGTLIQRTGNANTSRKFYPNGTDNDWSRAGLVETNLGTNGMPVYTDAAVRYVASLLEAGYYNNVSDSAYNCNSYIYETFVAANGKRTIHNTSTTAFSPQFEVTKSYANISNAYDLAWYLLNTIYQPDTEATVPVTDVNGQQREVPLYGMAVDAYKSIVLTDSGNGKYTFEAGYESNKVEYPRNVNFDRENGKIYNGGGDEKNLGFYPLEGLGYEQNDLLKNTSFTDSKHRNGGFTLRGESQFVYNEGANLYFTFTGDDDVYMYINGVLALDLGGAHGRNTKTVKLDSLDKDTYKLKDGEVATFTFFYMERCSDASTFGIETNMKLVQRDIAVEKNAYSDSQYTRPVNSGAVVDNGRDLFYDLVVTNKGNTVMTNFTFEDTDSFTGKANLGFDVTDASVTAGSGQVSLSANGYTCFVTDADGNQVGETKTVASLEELSTAVAGVKLAANQSLHVRFLKATVNVAESRIISYTNTIKVTASAGGARLWGDGSHSIYAYNDGGTARTYVVDFGLPLKIEKIFDPSAESYINGTITLNGQPKYGTAELTAAGYASIVVYRLNAHTTIDGQDTITLNVPYKFDNAERTLPKTLNIIPASNVYYEDSLAAFTNGKGVAENAKWSTVGNNDQTTTEDGGSDVYQALQQLGDKAIYGNDVAYNEANSSMLSMGTAHKVTVTAAMLEAYNGGNKDNFAWPTAQFTFKGTGFDIISLTDNTSGAIMVTVEGVTDTTYKKNFLVNNYYGYKYDKTSGEWGAVASGDSNAIYQIPVMKVNGIPYGEYKVTIGVLYNSLFDKTGNSAYSFWLDAVRIYDPMGEYEGYTQDNEGYPQYIKLHDEVVKEKATPNGNALFIDGAEKATIEQYTNLGPNNEVYLMKGQAITFKLTGDTGKIASVQIGAKAPKGTVELKVNDNEVVGNLSTATEMYYDITTLVTNDNNYQVTITNTTGNILSLTNLKITYSEKGSVSLGTLNTQEQESAVSLVRALFTAPVATFSPETFEADWGRAVRAGKRATLTVKTSADVESITVDGQSITSYTTRTQRTGWGWWSPKVTYHVFTYTITAPAQTTDYAVCAVNAEGTASEAVTATLTVKPTTWWNWWF